MLSPLAIKGTRSHIHWTAGLRLPEADGGNQAAVVAPGTSTPPKLPVPLVRVFAYCPG